MIGLGTIINVIAIITAGILGLLVGGFLSKSAQESITTACGICVIFIGISGALQQMLSLENGNLTVHGTMMMIVSLVCGILIGELLRIEQRIEAFGELLKQKTGNSGDSTFINGFVTASLTVCVGAMAVVGAIQDGISGDHTILITKSILDFIIILIMAASLGKGCIFSAVSVGIFQGIITIFARAVEPLMIPAAQSNLSYVGNIMIFCVGLNLIRKEKIHVGNMLPGLIIAVIWAFIPGLPA